ncbi:NINE protein [Agrococcus citreus]|uniref:TM2 domain-containing protein n=1 Tax=Agrococcus citreus TaxID=84643 RepID=A0ABN1YX56_9MICO
MTIQQLPSPGWYDDARGHRRWWDGRQWSAAATPTGPLDIAPPISAPTPTSRLDPRMMRDTTLPSAVVHHHVVHAPAKELSVAYLLLLFLGTLGAHRFYLGRNGSAAAMLSLTIVGTLTTMVLVGFLLLAAVAVWWVVDLFVTPGMVRDENRRASLRSGAPGYERGWPRP